MKLPQLWMNAVIPLHGWRGVLRLVQVSETGSVMCAMHQAQSGRSSAVAAATAAPAAAVVAVVAVAGSESEAVCYAQAEGLTHCVGVNCWPGAGACLAHASPKVMSHMQTSHG